MPGPRKKTDPNAPDEPIPDQLEVADTLADDPAPDTGEHSDDTPQTAYFPPEPVLAYDERDPTILVKWIGLVARLGTRNEEGRILAVPGPGRPPLPQLPLTVYLSRPDPATDRAAVGWVDRIWIDDHPERETAVHAFGRINTSTEHGRAIAGRLAEGEQLPVRLDILAEDPEADVLTAYHADWKLGSVTILSRPVDEHAQIRKLSIR